MAYFNGMRQYCIKNSLVMDPEDVKLIQKNHMKKLKHVLSLLFLKQLSREITIKYLETLDSYIDIFLYLYQKLLYSAGFPVFEKGRVMSSNQGTNNTIVFNCIIPSYEQFPRDLHLQTLNMASHILTKICQSNEADQRELAYHIEEYITLKYVIKINSKISSSTFYILRYAFNNKIPITALGNGLFQIGNGKNSTLISGSSTSADSAIGARVACDKYICNNLLRQAGIPIPAQMIYRNQSEKSWNSPVFDFPVVVKPHDRERGEGVIVNILDEIELKRAVRKTFKISNSVVVEEQITGVCHRIHIINNKFVAAWRRNPPSVIGNGCSSIAQLINERQAKRQNKASLLVSDKKFDEITIKTLEMQNLNLDTVLKKDIKVNFKPFNDPSWGGSIDMMSENIHPENIAVAERISRILRLNNVGIDFMSSDISIPWQNNNARVIEANYAPLSDGLDMSILFKSMINENGIIPIKVFVGGNAAIENAKNFWEQMTDGIFLTNNVCFDKRLINVPLFGNNLYEKCKSLLIDVGTIALICVVNSSEWMESGSPFNQEVEVIDSNDALYDEEDLKNQPKKIKIIELLNGFR